MGGSFLGMPFFPLNNYDHQGRADLLELDVYLFFFNLFFIEV